MKRNSHLIVAFVSIASFFISTNAFAVVIQAGIVDAFAPPADPASPSMALAAVINGSFGGTQDFDMTAGINGGLGNRSVAHTFESLPTIVSSATLEMRVRAGTNTLTTTDGLILSLLQSAASDYFERHRVRKTVWGFQRPIWLRVQ